MRRRPSAIRFDISPRSTGTSALAPPHGASVTRGVVSMVGHKFSLITILDQSAPLFDRHAVTAGLVEQLPSVRAVNIPVPELGDTERVVEALVEQSAKAPREDGPHLIVFGRAGMIGLAGEVEKGLVVQDTVRAPVFDPDTLTVAMAKVLIGRGLTHSRRTYPQPPEVEHPTATCAPLPSPLPIRRRCC